MIFLLIYRLFCLISVSNNRYIYYQDMVHTVLADADDISLYIYIYFSDKYEWKWSNLIKKA